MQPSKRILVVEDELAMAGNLEQALRESGYQVTVATNGRQGLGLAPNHDLVIADLMMPVMNGLEMIRQLREKCNDVPVLIITAKDSVDDRVTGLDMGADDYLVKPFKLSELLARVRALLRRTKDGEAVLTLGDLTVDTRAHKVKRHNTVIYLSNTEYALLMLLLKNAGRVVSKQMILREVWDDADGTRNLNVVEVYIKYLRGKLEAMGRTRMVYTVRGLGYTLRASDSKP